MISWERKQARDWKNQFDDDGRSDDRNGGDDDYANNRYGGNLIKNEVPGSAIAFQAITSFVL